MDTPNPELVVLLRTKLEEAERGELIGIAIATEYANGGVLAKTYLGDGSSAYRLAGGIVALQERLVREHLVPDLRTEYVTVS